MAYSSIGADSRGGLGYRYRTNFNLLWSDMSPHEAIPSWGVVALATVGVIIRPFRVPEAVFALADVAALLLLGLLPVGDAIRGVGTTSMSISS